MRREYERDTFTKEKAARLAEIIERYWLTRGYRGIKCEVVQESCELDELWGAKRNLWFVRSNVGPSGFPPRQVVENAA